MSNNWTITALYFGEFLSPRAMNCSGLDPEIILKMPFTGFLLRNGEQNILVDTGLSDDAFEGLPTEGFGFVYGKQYIIDELAREGLKPDDIDAVIYTHLHFDHAGNPDMFPNAITYIQKDEYNNLLEPYDFQIAYPPEYLLNTMGKIKTLKHIALIDGDVKLPNGLELYEVKGHSLGGQAIVVPTAKGRYVITGDTPPDKTCLFPGITSMKQMDGTEFQISPMHDPHAEFLYGTGIMDRFGARDSYRKLLYLAEKPEPEYFLTSHWPENIYIRYFG